jgi:hypothetical protein
LFIGPVGVIGFEACRNPGIMKIVLNFDRPVAIKKVEFEVEFF